MSEHDTIEAIVEQARSLGCTVELTAGWILLSAPHKTYGLFRDTAYGRGEARDWLHSLATTEQDAKPEGRLDEKGAVSPEKPSLSFPVHAFASDLC